MSRPKEVPAETHLSIDQQIDAFLKSGKKIQKIPHGVSGQPIELGEQSKPGKWGVMRPDQPEKLDK